MSPKKYLFDIVGEISKILTNSSAVIDFTLDGKTEQAFLKKEKFYHNGRLNPCLPEVPLSKYIHENMQVKFSCHKLDTAEEVSPHTVYYKWYVMMCWVRNTPLTEVSISSGLSGAAGTIVEISKRRGIMATLDSGEERRVMFRANAVYLGGKKFSSSKMLNTQLCLQERMYFDAVPCMSEESRQNCDWFATCAFQGQRPRLPNLSDVNCSDPQAIYASQIPNNNVNGEDSKTNNRPDPFQPSPTNFKAQLYKIIKMHTNNVRTLFSTGYGYLLTILNDEFGIILGCFRKNVFQTILFHRNNTYLCKVSLARSKLSEIFCEGDRMKFIAVGAPPEFYTDWIAVQVSVTLSADSDKDNIEM